MAPIPFSCWAVKVDEEEKNREKNREARFSEQCISLV